MSFPFDYHGQVSLPLEYSSNIDLFESNFLSAAIEHLNNAKASKIRVEDSRIIFKGGLFRFVSNCSILVSVSHGYIDFVQAEVPKISYYLNFREIFFVVLILQIVIFVPVSIGVIAKSHWGALLVLLLPWLWLFGANIALTIFRFHMLVKKVAKIRWHIEK